MVNAQEYIKQSIFDHEVKILDLEGQELEDHLDLSEFTNLEEIKCSYNELTSLDVSKCTNLKKIDCSYNLFDDLMFLAKLPNPEKLIYLNIEECGAFISLEEKVKALMSFVNLEKTEEEMIIESLLRQLQENKEKLGELIKQNSHLKEENDNLKNNRQQFEKELFELQNQIGLTKEQKKAIDKAARELKNLLNQNQEANSQLQNDLETEAANLVQKIATLAQENSRLNKNLERTKDNFSYLKTQLTQKETRLQELQSNQAFLTAEQIAEKQQLETELTNLRKKLVDLEQEKTILSEQLVQAEKELAEKQELEVQLNQLKTELTNKKNELSSVKQELFEQKWVNKAGTAFLRKKVEKLESELFSLKEQFQKTQVQIKESNKIKTASTIPQRWQELLKEENKLSEDHSLQEVTYEEVWPNDHHPFFWETNSKKILETSSLPIKLYNVNTEEIVKNNKDFSIKRYATVSYVCNDHVQTLTKRKIGEKELELSSSSIKALMKAQETCRMNEIDIDYLWMDKLCINQNDLEEKAEEVGKMQDYYSNSSVTLISINTNLPEYHLKLLSWPDITKMIICSEWFTRSWTFQEGWLSKQTIFMFDNALIDGREIAKQWVINQPSYADYANHSSLLSESSQKIATPLGWIYCEKGYNSEDFLLLTLNQVLRGVKERKRTLPVDGIYSIIGLLPYSKKIKVDYSLTPQQALFNIMKIAWENGYAEPIAWHGSGSSWLPKIDKNGSVDILGGLKIIGKPQSIKFGLNHSLEVKASRHTIKNVFDDKINRIEEGFLIEGGTYTKEVQLKVLKNNHYIWENFTLLGTKESLEGVKKNNELLLFNENEWAREDKESFALLVARDGKIQQRIGIVEMRKEQVEKIEKREEKKVVIKGIEEVWQYQAQQEVFPKK